jgi:transposase-like protein
MGATTISTFIDGLINTDIEIKAFLLIIISIILITYFIKSRIVMVKKCPSCKTEKAYRTGQNFIELYIFKLEYYKKYKCVNCARAFYIRHEN